MSYAFGKKIKKRSVPAKEPTATGIVVGSKSQVYKGSADRTSGGLEKKDIVYKDDGYGNKRYYSKAQLASAKKNKKSNTWMKACDEAREELEIKGFVPFQKTKAYKRGSGVTKKVHDQGYEYYRLATKIHKDM